MEVVLLVLLLFWLLNKTSNSFCNSKLSDEALYLASPVLLAEKNKNEVKEKTLISLKKYQQRAFTRCTPFGLFAGCGVAQWSNINNIKPELSYKSTRLDMNVICEITALLLRIPAIKINLISFFHFPLFY